MGYTPLGHPQYESEQTVVIRRKSSWVLHLGLFLLTFACTMMAGTAWVMQNPLEISNWGYGVQYALLIMGFLAAHEFGHYFAARFHGVDATLPYFIPVPPLVMPFGTMGAVIKTRSEIMTRRALFDIGVSGPIAGFVVSLAYLIIGMAFLPPKESLYLFHPEYRMFGGAIPEWGMHFGDTLLYSALAKLIVNPTAFLPPMNEMYHYPMLCVGWFGLFVTSMNLLPIGQLDGGHITHAMLGERQSTIGRIVWWCIFLLGLGSVLGFVRSRIIFDSPDALYMFFQSLLLPPLNVLNTIFPWYYQAWSGWLLWAFILRVFVKIEHPFIGDPEPLDTKRMIVGWVAIAIFVLTFSYNGIYEIDRTEQNAIPHTKGKGSIIYHPNHNHEHQLKHQLTNEEDIHRETSDLMLSSSVLNSRTSSLSETTSGVHLASHSAQYVHSAQHSSPR